MNFGGNSASRMSSEASELQDGDGPNRKKIKTNECVRLVFPRAFIEACPDPLTCQIWIRCFSCLTLAPMSSV